MTYYSDTKQFFQNNYDQLTRCALFIIRNRVDGDVVHDQLSQFYIVAERTELLKRFDPTKASIDTYVFNALKNSIYDHLYGRKARSYTGLNDSMPDKAPYPNDVEIDLSGFAKYLTKSEWHLMADLISGKTPKDIAARLDCTQANVSFIRKSLYRKWLQYYQ